MCKKSDGEFTGEKRGERPDKEAGLREMRRVTRGRIVLLTFDPSHRPWLTDQISLCR